MKRQRRGSAMVGGESKETRYGREHGPKGGKGGERTQAKKEPKWGKERGHKRTICSFLLTLPCLGTALRAPR